MPTSKKTICRLAVSAVAVTTLLAGCGGSESSDPASSEPTGSASAAPTPSIAAVTDRHTACVNEVVAAADVNLTMGSYSPDITTIVINDASIDRATQNSLIQMINFATSKGFAAKQLEGTAQAAVTAAYKEADSGCKIAGDPIMAREQVRALINLSPLSSDIANLRAIRVFA